MKKRITLKHIANEFNVSIATVSRALSDSHEISAKTREKIQQYAKEHNYKPNSVALSLLNKKTKTIGVIIPTLLNHFFVKVFSGVEQIANEKGYNVIIIISHGEMKKEIESANMLEKGTVDGLLISVTEETQSKQHFNHLKEFIQDAGPIVMFDRVSDSVECDKIIVDDFNCAYNATEHLIKTGCKNIVIISVLDDLGIVTLRINGYKQALKDHGIEVNEKLILLVKKEYDFETEVKTLLDYNAIDAIIGLEEYSTIESMFIAKSRGYKIPEDISFIGYTNGNLFKYVNPSITCINQHAVYIGKKATEKLIERIEQNDNSESVYETKIIKTSLVLRNSTHQLS
ncbi:LacI family DNA-binding transcriptional regulator [Seonamhaeicola sp.]|uniref:LacI family DNA-binding transcriptional regulator n=1 Tax=Seonamhaeicola sp. TaxID=1912245 RepID=UPI0026192308|nr:LacI family DNA-binding transcriptional regulator [Seonamhaeicola sp.]